MYDATDLYHEFDGERLPPGQRQTDGFPVLSKGEAPAVARDDGTLEVFGRAH
jgi:hypothetical protein